MKELWIKKTVYKRLLIQDEDIELVKELLTSNTTDCVDLITDLYDMNQQQEYDQDETILPIDYLINRI